MVITYPIGKSLYVNLTNRCPCSCVFCLRNRASGVHGSGSLWLEREPAAAEVIASIDSRDMRRFEELVFCGYGEPTERIDDLLLVGRHVRSAYPEVKIRINTNGLGDLVNSRGIADGMKGLVDTVSVSLNTPDAEEYERICRPKFGNKSWKAMIDFTASLKGIVPNVVMTVVGEPVTSAEKIEKCRAVAASVGASLRVRPYEG
jgi:radical SAM enzyme (TIGR04100 family)